MAPTAPPADNTRSAAKPLPIPPEERFWKRYSPHGELPLSGAGSFAIHVLFLGLLLLSLYLSYILFNNAARSLPVEAVRLDTGGGGGRPTGVEGGSGAPTAPVEVGPENQQPKEASTPDPVKRPDLTLKGPRPPAQFPNPQRVIAQSDTDGLAAFRRLAQAQIHIRLPDGPNNPGPIGRGGNGSGGGQGDGTGTGTGNGRGEGNGKLTQREKRMLRWSMLFNTNNGPDYLKQLQGLGAILAIPVNETPTGRQYKLVRDLSRRPAKLLDEPIDKIQRIYWIDDKPQSVQDIMMTLGVPFMPSHFVAFMPEELEAKLFKLEKERLARDYPGRSEDDIDVTKFRIKREGFEPEVMSLKMK